MNITAVLIGLLSGITAAMGLGGGFVLLIYLTAFAGINQLQAQGINLLFFLPIAILSIILHLKNKLIDPRPLLFCLIFGAVGVFIGSLLAFHLPVHWLSKGFAVLIFIIGIKETFSSQEKNKPQVDGDSSKKRK